MKKIYLDYNATTPVDPRVLEAMMPYFRDGFGNPSSIHSFGMRGKVRSTARKEQVAALYQCQSGEIVFTSGERATATLSGRRPGGCGEGNHLVTTKVEHESVLGAFRSLERSGFRVTYLGVDASGIIYLDELRDSISDETILVSCIFANNETGTVMPIAGIARIAKEKGAIFHTDAVQAAGKISIDTDEIPADLLTLSAHKFYGPKGAGALYIREGINKRVRLLPLIHGGGQERGGRSAPRTPAIAGMGMASEIALCEMKEDERG
jgi:cysteine desulfurase